MKNSKLSQFFYLVVIIVLGAVLVIYPGDTLTVAVKVLGAGLLISAIVAIVSLLVRKDSVEMAVFPWVGAIVTAIAGLVILLNPELIISVVPIIAGSGIILYGAFGFMHAISYKKSGFTGWQVSLVFSLLTVGFGILIVANPFGTATIIVRLIGIILIYQSVSEIWFRILKK